MRFLHIPKGSGYMGAVYLLLGSAEFIAAFGFFVFNILFSAFGLMQMTGGIINWDFSNPYIPTLIIISGGKIGLVMAILGGLLASVIEGRLWAVPTKSKSGNKSSIDRKGLFVLFSMIFVLYDVCSTYFFLNGGSFLDISHGWNSIFESLIILVVTLILFSIGPEMFMLQGIETAIENYKEGIPALGIGLAVIITIIKGFFGLFITAFQKTIDWETDENESEKVKDSFQSQEKRGRGRPSRNEYSGNESEI